MFHLWETWSNADVLCIVNTLAPGIILSHDSPVTLGRKKQPSLYEPCNTLVALTNLIHLPCPSCGGRNELFHSTKTASKRHNSVTHRCLSWYWN
jgi:hypothetical protein